MTDVSKINQNKNYSRLKKLQKKFLTLIGVGSLLSLSLFFGYFFYFNSLFEKEMALASGLGNTEISVNQICNTLEDCQQSLEKERVVLAIENLDVNPQMYFLKVLLFFFGGILLLGLNGILLTMNYMKNFNHQEISSSFTA